MSLCALVYGRVHPAHHHIRPQLIPALLSTNSAKETLFPMDSLVWLQRPLRFVSRLCDLNAFTCIGSPSTTAIFLVFLFRLPSSSFFFVFLLVRIFFIISQLTPAFISQHFVAESHRFRICFVLSLYLFRTTRWVHPDLLFFSHSPIRSTSIPFSVQLQFHFVRVECVRVSERLPI